jgi:hypothetical protein
MKYTVIFIIIFILQGEIYACKYSVRDVAFVNLDHHSYQLYFITNEKLSGEQSQEIADITKVFFNESNIQFHAVSQAEFEDEIILDEKEEIQNPRLVLIDQEGRHFSKPASSKNSVTEKELVEFLNSPIREKLVSRFLHVHSIVLLLEGKEEQWNKRASEIIKGTIENVSQSMQELPKKIATHPVLLRFSPKDQKQEKVLLWSLGIDKPISEEAQIVILYGKGRMLGSVFKVPGLTQTELSHYLNYVGQDCECELDRTGMKGVMIPLKWDIQTQAEASKLLGFNPENDFIKEEVNQILARGAKRSGKSIEKRTFQSDPILGYSEINIEKTSDLTTDLSPQNERPETIKTSSKLAPQLSTLDEINQDKQENHWLNSALFVLILMLGVYLASRSSISES